RERRSTSCVTSREWFDGRYQFHGTGRRTTGRAWYRTSIKRRGAGAGVGRSPGQGCRAVPGLSSLVERAVVGADRVDLRRRRGLRVELEVEPHLHQLLRELQPDHTLAHTEDLRVVREHRTLHGVEVVRGDGADAGD